VTDKPAAAADIDEYIARFPAEIQAILEKVRATVREAAPAAEEAIKYRMPAFTRDGFLVSFEAHKKHLGFYPAPIGVAESEEELAPYASGRGTARFAYDQPIPYDLIARIVKYWVEQKAGQQGR
jgi:uncharacterized protein YdhG (YjbR/CyaY superfamily)